jgi:hypothetical protein
VQFALPSADYAYTLGQHWAALNGHTQMVKMLVEAGADLNPISDAGLTPLDMVFHNSNATDICQFLISRGAKSTSEIQRGFSFAAQNRCTRAPQELDYDLDSGFESDGRENLQRTPKARQTPTHLKPPVCVPAIDLKVPNTESISFNVSRKMAASALHNTTENVTATPAHSEPSEEPFASPWPMSQFIRPYSTPTAFFFEQSPHPSGLPLPRAPMLENLTKAELNMWATPQMVIPKW